MSLETVSHGQESLVVLKRVFCAIATAIPQGTPFAYNRDSILSAQRGLAEAVSVDGPSRHRTVEALTEANIEDFAGVANRPYAANANGNWLELETPVEGGTVTVQAYASCAINAPPLLYPVLGTTYWAAASGNLKSPWAIKPIQTIDRGTTAGIVQGVWVRSDQAQRLYTANPYQVDTVQKYPLFFKHEDLDGRLWRYISAGAGGLLGGFGAACQVATILAYEAVHGTVAAGSLTVTLEQAGVTLDQYAGGYIILGHDSGATAETHRVVSNTASDGSNHVVFTLDYPLGIGKTDAVSGIEIIPAPWSGLRLGGANAGYLEKETFLGIPAVAIAASSFGFIQRRGPCWPMTGGGTTPGDSANDRTVYFVGDGSVNGGAHLTYAGKSYQKAGYIMDYYGAQGSPPLVWLELE